MADQFELSFFDDSGDTSQQGSEFERKSDVENDAKNTKKTWQGPKDPREGKGAGKYPNYWSYKTRSGHNIMYDDSKGNESITIQHRGGSAMQFMPNGAIHMTAHNGKYDIVFGENRMTVTGAHDLTVKGEGSMLVYGNYRKTIHGNMEVACTGSYNITAKDMIMNPRDNFSIAGKKGTMKFSESAQISANKTVAMVGGENASLNGGKGTYVGGGESTYVAGKSTLSMYTDGKAFLNGKDNLDIGSKNTKIAGSEEASFKGGTMKISADTMGLKGDKIDLDGQKIGLKGTTEIPKLISMVIPGGNAQGAKAAPSPDTKLASAQGGSSGAAESTPSSRLA